MRTQESVQQRKLHSVNDMGAMGVLEKLLPVIDNFERGLEAVSEEEKDSAFVKGIEQIYKQFVAVMEDSGSKHPQWMRKEKNSMQIFITQ